MPRIGSSSAPPGQRRHTHPQTRDAWPEIQGYVPARSVLCTSTSFHHKLWRIHIKTLSLIVLPQHEQQRGPNIKLGTTKLENRQRRWLRRTAVETVRTLGDSLSGAYNRYHAARRCAAPRSQHHGRLYRTIMTICARRAQVAHSSSHACARAVRCNGTCCFSRGTNPVHLRRVT